MALTAVQKLNNLIDAMIDDIMALTDDELMAEMVEELGSNEAVEAECARIKQVILDAFPVR